MDQRGAAGGEPLDLASVQVNAVGEDAPRPQHARTMESLDDADAVLGDAALLVRRRLGGMDVDPGRVLGRQLSSPSEGLVGQGE